MSPASRRFLALVVVFVTAFVAVATIRTWRNGGDFRNIFPWFAKKSGEFHPERFTLPDHAPLDLGDVELLSRLNIEYAKLTEAVIPSVVSIDTAGIRSEQYYLWGRTRVRNYPTQGQGSGVIVTKEGHVMTNHHVIAGQQKIQVTLHGGKVYTARLIGEDTLLDIAVLKIESNEIFIPLKLGDSSQTRVGQMVFAVGNPFGLGETVTQGIISAKERSLSDNQRDLFQTDAAINPGNSGGPLVNLRGEIIGINVAIFSRDKENPAYQGVGFSIPSNDVKDSLFQILERGRPVRGFLGVQMHDLDPQMRAMLGYHEGEGAAILRVASQSPAEEAGLQQWDVVREVNGEKILSSSQLLSLVQRTKVGRLLKLSVFRQGKTLELEATVKESKSESASRTSSEDQGRVRGADEVIEAMGVKVRNLTPVEQARGYRGAMVVDISISGLARDKLRVGDVVVTINQIPISGLEDFTSHLAASAAVQDTVMNIVRGGQLMRLILPAVPREQ